MWTMLNSRSAARMKAPSLFTLLFVLFCAATPASAQKDGEMEEFEEVDPYTKGERDLERALGYKRFGFFPWRYTDDTKSVQENMGGIPMIWVETEHFLIGSSLGTYKIPNDREERKLIKEEIAQLKKKLGKLKAPKKKLDPYLRLHIYAQRLERLYAAFVEDLGLTEADFGRSGTHLGHKDKFRVLLCQRKSEYSRYLLAYEKQDIEFSYRTGWRGEGMLFLANVEAIAENWKKEPDAPIDTMFYCLLSHNIANNFIDGFHRQYLFQGPDWLVYGLGHVYTKRIDERYPFFDGRKVIYDKHDESWNWQPRVRNLVKNDFYTSAEKMFTWTDYSDLGPRDHLISWSKLEYLMSGLDGDLKQFISLSCYPLASNPRAQEESESELVTRQTRALKESFNLTPAELDANWAKWVEKTYKKK
jgi:hypothetical protein